VNEWSLFCVAANGWMKTKKNTTLKANKHLFRKETLKNENQNDSVV